MSKSLGSRTVQTGYISKGKDNGSQSLQMMERPLMTADELKSMPKGQFIVMKTGAHPMKVKLKLFFQWGISFGAPHTVPDKGNRPVAYAGKEALVQAIQEKYPPQEEPQQPKAKEQPPQPGPEDKKLHASSPGRRQTKPGKEREDDRP